MPHTRLARLTPLLAAALLLAAPAAASVESEIAFHRGVLAYGQERFAEARAEFETVLRDDPEDTAAIRYLALIAEAEGRNDDALASYDRALAIDPADPDVLLDKGVLLLEMQRNQEARELLEQAVAADPDRAKAQLFAGVAAYRMGDYAQAVPRLERAVELDPDLRGYAQYYAGISQVFLGDLPNAAEAFGEVESGSPIAPLASSAATLRSQIQPAQEAPRRWELAFTAGLEGDTNPRVLGDDSTIDREDDGRGVFRMRGQFSLYDDGRFRLLTGYDGFLSVHFHEEEVDLQTHVPYAAASMRVGPVNLGMRYDFGYTFIDLTERFRRVHRATPSAVWQQGEFGLLQGFFQYQDKSFLFTPVDPALDRDGNQYTVGVNQFFYLPPFNYVRVGALGDWNDSEGSEYRYDGFEFSVGAGYDLPFQVQATGLYRFIRRYYRRTSIFSPFSERDDYHHRISLELARLFGEHIEASLAGSINVFDSNIGVFDYNRYIVGGYLTYRF